MKTLSVLIAFSFALARPARADGVAGIVFVAQPVRFPVAPDRVMPVAPFVPSGVAETTRAIEVGPGRGAALWLDALDVIQVRKLGGDGVLSFARVVGTGTTRATIAESGASIADGVTYLAQPPGGGDVWMIWAERAATIRVERPVARDGRAIWETTQRALVAWVDRGGPRPEIPVVDGGSLAALRIDADASTGRAIEALEPSLRTAVHAWRKASIVAELAAVRPFVVPQLRVEPIALAGTGRAVSVLDPRTPDPQPYRTITQRRAIDVELEGPGALRVEVRALLPTSDGGAASNAPELPDVSLAIARGDTTLARRTVPAAYATTGDDRAAPPAFPTKLVLSSREGDTLGERVMVTVPLYPGSHRYRITLGEGALAIRATVARHRARMPDAVGPDDVDELLAKAQAAIASSSPASDLVHALIAAARGAAPREVEVAKLPPSLQAAALATAGHLGGRAAIARAVKATDRTHAWTHALAIARRLPDGAAVRALYEVVPGAPPAFLVPELVELLPRSTALERVRNWPLAVTLLAARARPVDPTVIAAARARWRAGAWAPLRPAIATGDRDPVARRWVVEAQPQPLATPRGWRAGDLARLEPGRTRAVTAAAAMVDPARAAVLDVFVAAPARAPVDIVVDGRRFRTIAVAPVERVQFAVTPGRHEVTIAGPTTLRGWISQQPAELVAAAERARVQSLWPLSAGGDRVRFALPSVDLPLEVTLRATDAITRPVRVTIRSDVGPATEVTITGAARDLRAHDLALADTVTEEVRFVVWPARGARAVWLESRDPRVVASIATRRERSNAPDASAPAPTADPNDVLARVTRASRALADDARDTGALVRRANALLDLGEVSLAREDLVRLLKLPERRGAAAVEEELFARLDDGADPTHVALAAAPREPVLVGPAIAALATDRHDAGLRAALEARLQLARGDTAGAAGSLIAAYQATDRWQVGLEAVGLLADVLTDRARTPPVGTAAVAYGLASRIRAAIDHPRVRRALVIAAAQSGWDTLGAMQSSAGHELVVSTRPILPPAPSVLVREALVAPSWQAAHTVSTGKAAMLDILLPGAMTITAHVHCVRVRSADLARAEATAPCALTVRVDNALVKPLAAPLGRGVELAIPLTAGRHVIAVALASQGDAASVRFASERAIAGLTDPPDAGGGHPIRIERRAKLFSATATTSIATTVQGPTTLWIQARSLGVARAAEVTASSAGGAVRATLALADDRDPDARVDGRGAPRVMSSPVDGFLVLPDATTYRVSVTADRGELVARLAVRRDRRGKAPRVPRPWYESAPIERGAFEIATPPAAGAIDASVDDAPAIGRAGTFSIDLQTQQDTRGDEDVASLRPGSFFEGGLTFRRALVPHRLWIMARAGARSREGTAAIATASGELDVDRLPLGATLQLASVAYTQAFSEGRAWHVRGRARIGWRLRWTDTLTARPSLGFSASYLNTTEEIAAAATDRIDPDVYNLYRDTHARDATPMFALQWMPLQDFVGEVRASATTNTDLASLDHAGVGIGVRLLAPLPLLGETLLAASYRPNYRFADADRPAGFWRHDLGARVEWTVWTTTQGRFVLWVSDAYDPGTRNALGAGLRFDLVRHRGLADFAPTDTPFASLIDDRAYAPLEAP